MGTSSSKFKKYLQHGDEYAAMQVYQNSSELRKNLHPNFGYGDHHQHNTPIHYASRHGMKHLIRAFLSDLDGNPNKRNGLRQTSLHSVCQVIGQQKSPSALERRSYSVMLLLSWRGPLLPNGQRERIDINAQDAAGYTALHYAAQSGLKRCVEYLIAHGANVFLETLHERLTACDLAIKENHPDIALFLESKMVFNSTPESLSVDSSGGKRTRNSSLDAATADCSNEVYGGLRAQDLQEAKDQLLVETADLLHVPLFTAEALLKHSEWSREILLDKWLEDPFTACKLAGVDPPSSLSRRHIHQDQCQEQLQIGTKAQPSSRPTIRLNITKQPVPFHYPSEPPAAVQHLSKTLPCIKDKLPIFSCSTLTKSMHLNSIAMNAKPSHVPKNDQCSNSPTMQHLQKPNLHFNKPKMIYSANSFIVDETLEEDELLCELCCDLIESDHINSKEISSNDLAIKNDQLKCGHSFCSKCWKDYLKDKINETDPRQVFCPGYECNVIVPNHIIELYVPPRPGKQQSTSRDNNVHKDGTIKLCPYTGCQRAVKLLDVENDLNATKSTEDNNDEKESANAKLPLSISHAADCGGGHYFCWECGKEAHAPLGCNFWKKWIEKCSLLGVHENKIKDKKYLKSFSWLITDNKPCPKCSTLVEKDDGCNHVMCKQCRYEFCWLCLAHWKNHGIGSGGYLKCSKFFSFELDQITAGEDIREEQKFAHYYVRYKNHENSLEMEKSLLISIEKNEITNYLGQEHAEDCGRNTKLYVDCLWELIKARMVLHSSYAYGYFLEPNSNPISYNELEMEENPIETTSTSSFKALFEATQSELEEMTESLAEMIERPYLRNSRRTIIQTSQLCRKKRQEFLIEIYREFKSVNNITKRSFKDNISKDTKMVKDASSTRLDSTLIRKPLTQIQSQHALCLGTLPRKVRAETCRKRSTEDPWLVKENHLEKLKMESHIYKCEKPIQSTNEDSQIGENYSLRMCKGKDCGTKFWGKSLQNYDNSYCSQNKGQFCSLKCVKSFEAAKCQVTCNIGGCESFPLDDVNVDSSLKLNRKDMESYESCRNNPNHAKENVKFQTISSNQSIWTKERRNKENYLQELPQSSPYHNDLGKFLYTLPRTSRSDDNLLLEEKPNFSVKKKSPPTNSHKDDGSNDPDQFKIQGETTMTLESKSMSTDGLESSNAANETVNSFLKSLSVKETTKTPVVVSRNRKTNDSHAENSNKDTEFVKPELSKEEEPLNSLKNIPKKHGVVEEKVSLPSMKELDKRFCRYNTSRKNLHQGYDKRVVIKFLKRSRSTGEINQSGKKVILGHKASHHKKSSANRGSKRFSNKSSRSKVLNDLKTPFQKTLLLEEVEKNNFILRSKETKGRLGHDDLQGLKSASTHAKDISKLKKRLRPKFGRQKAFDMDSDSNDVDITKERDGKSQTNKATIQPDTFTSKDQLLESSNEKALFEKNDLKGKDNREKSHSLRGDQKKCIGSPNDEVKVSPTPENKKSNVKKRHPGLTIKIHNSSMADDSELPDTYETNELLASLSKDSSLYSPTLHISGIAINRSPGAAPLSASTVTESLTSKRNRSASLVVPPPTPQTAPLKHLTSNAKGVASCNTSPRSPGTSTAHFSYLSSPITTCSATLTTPSSSPYKSYSNQQQLLFTFPDPPNLGTPTKITTTPTSKNVSPAPSEINKNCRSPSTTKLLSSVLHVQESCLSSDDFHEALFLDKKSPSRTLNKKKRKARKKDASNLVNVGANSCLNTLASDEGNKIHEETACSENKDGTID